MSFMDRWFSTRLPGRWALGVSVIGLLCAAVLLWTGMTGQYRHGIAGGVFILALAAWSLTAAWRKLKVERGQVKPR